MHQKNNPKHKVDIAKLKQAVSLLDFNFIRQYFHNHNVVDIAQDVIEWEEIDVATLFRLLSTKKSADLFTHLPPIYQKKLVHIFTSKDIEKLLGDIYSDDIVDILEDLPANLTKKILTLTKKMIAKLLISF